MRRSKWTRLSLKERKFIFLPTVSLPSSSSRCVDYCIQKGFPFWGGGGGGGVGKGENRHFSRATRSVSCARFAHTLAKIIEKKKQEEEGLKQKLGPRLRFPLQFNSSQGHLDCHLFQIWNMTRLSKMSRVLGNRTTLFDY